MVTLVPAAFFDPASARSYLCEVAEVPGQDEVKSVELTQFKAYLVYNISEGSPSDSLPEMFHILNRLSECQEYNKILASWDGSVLSLAIAQGRMLLLANEYRAHDFTTVQYYIFLALKSLQLNPEVSTISWMSPLRVEDEMSLYRYFKAVDCL